MARRLVSLVMAVVFSLAGTPMPMAAENPAVTDPEVLKGIRQVEDGEYDTAIMTLDAAARRLAPTHGRDVAQAYLYLGIAYFGKGQEAAAKARFREAVREIGDLSLSPDKFAPKVINLFEAARDEVGPVPARAAASTPAPTPARAGAATPTPAVKKGGGGAKKALLIGGGAVVALGVAGAVAGSGGGSSPTPSGPTPATQTPTPAPGPTTERFTGKATAGKPGMDFPFQVRSAGEVSAKVNWPSAPNAKLGFNVFEAGNPAPLAQPKQPGPNSLELTVTLPPKAYVITVGHQGGTPDTVDFDLTISHP